MAEVIPAASGLTNNGNKRGVKHKRTRDGCLCCRLRKKKCDGVRPTCIACERNILICSWPTSNGNQQAKTPQNVTGNTPNCQIPSLVAGNSLDYNSTDSCQGKLPQSPQRDVSSILSLRSLPSMIRSENELVYRNYVMRTANTVSTLQDAENPFINILLPLAESNSLVLDSILALSAAHLWKQPEHTAEAEKWMSTHETLAIRGLKYGLTNIVSKSMVDASSSVVMIITTLILYLVEAMKGETNLNAIFHLKGCRMLLCQWVSTEEAVKEPKIRAFIVELYLYLAISIEMPLREEFEPHNSVAQDAALLFPYIETGEHCGPLLGCAHELFELIPQIHMLAHTCSTGYRGIATTLEIRTTFQWLIVRISAWKPPNGAKADFVSCARIYKAALLVFLVTSTENVIQQSINTAIMVDQAFDTAVQELDKLPMDSPITTTLTWPLAVLGASSNVPEYQDAVRTRLLHLSRNLHFAVFHQVLCVLEALWADDSMPKRMSGFEAVMKRLKMHVLIS